MKDTVYTVYLTLLCACYEDIASAYPAQYEVERCRDLACLKARFRFEGVAFLTKSLPSLGKAIDKALSTGTVLQVPTFARKKGSKLPRFLGWLIGRVFSTQGIELDSSDSMALMHIRQFLYLFYKLEMPYTDEDTTRVIEEFKSVDAKLNTPWLISDPSHASVIKGASGLIHRVLGGLSTEGLTPKHGPGSVATGEKSHSKPYFRRDIRTLTEVYPLDEYFYMNAAHIASRLTDRGLNTLDPRTSRLTPWEELETGTAKVVLVPKDSRGPRLISMEPLETQWIQQGQLERLVKRIESNWLTAGHVNFEKQGVNRLLAYLGSHPDPVTAMESSIPSWVHNEVLRSCSLPLKSDLLSDNLVTLDMKEASDRVSLSLVQMLFPSNWVRALEATRSPQTMLPNGEVFPLNKFAPMGSAVCFPVEALCFWALGLSALMHTYPYVSLDKLTKKIWVYGDDIVCYKKDYLIIKHSLERVGLLLNANKCCTAGLFRESCGLDSYKGSNVTPLRIKKCVPHHHWDGQHLAAYVSYSNDAWARGLTNLAEALESVVQPHVLIPYTTVERGFIQFVRPEANVQALNRLYGVKTRFCRKLHILTAYGPAPKAVVTKGHKVTQETYFNRFVSRYRDELYGETPLGSLFRVRESDLTHLESRRLLADQHSVPRRVTSTRGWKQISLH